MRKFGQIRGLTHFLFVLVKRRNKNGKNRDVKQNGYAGTYVVNYIRIYKKIKIL